MFEPELLYEFASCTDDATTPTEQVVKHVLMDVVSVSLCDVMICIVKHEHACVLSSYEVVLFVEKLALI